MDISDTTGIVMGIGDTITVFPQESTYYTACLEYTNDCGNSYRIWRSCYVSVPTMSVIASEHSEMSPRTSEKSFLGINLNQL